IEHVSRKPLFWIGSFALAGLISISTAPDGLAQTATDKKATASGTSPKTGVRHTTARASSTHAAAAKQATGAARPIAKPASPPSQKRALYSAQRSLSRKAALARARVIATARAINDSAPRHKMVD